jgi:hypothetical protein
LEHFYRHDAIKVLRGFAQSLTEDGFAHILVPDIGEVMRQFATGGMDIESVLYETPDTPITVHDVIYGWGLPLMLRDNDFMAHKTGFTLPLLKRFLGTAGFKMVRSAEHKGRYEIEVFAYLKE